MLSHWKLQDRQLTEQRWQRGFVWPFSLVEWTTAAAQLDYAISFGLPKFKKNNKSRPFDEKFGFDICVIAAQTFLWTLKLKT